MRPVWYRAERPNSSLRFPIRAIAVVWLLGQAALAQSDRDPNPTDPPTPGASAAEAASADDRLAAPSPPKLPEPADARRLDPKADAWIDDQRDRVIVDGRISLRAGPLEMFACPRGTKEHESIVSVQAPAFLLHAALLAIGAEPGGPVQFDPQYKPPTGDEIVIEVFWFDAAGRRQRTRAQEWVRDARTKQAMTAPWVFAGSGFWNDEEAGRQVYLAEAGDLICVSNFSSAMLDIPMESTDSNEGRFFEAYTERLPALGTPVRLVLRKAPSKPDTTKPAGTAPAALPTSQSPK